MTVMFLASLWLYSMKNISFSPLYLLNIVSICVKGIRLSCLDAINIPGVQIFVTSSSISTSSISKSALERMIGLMYLKATLSNIYGKWVLCLPISKNSFLRD
jgi:hypothetical protein